MVTTQVNVAEAKAKLSDLVERAANGEDIIIARSGKPRVRLVPIAERTQPRRFGQLKGKIWFGPDFDDDLTDMFECLQEDGSDTQAQWPRSCSRATSRSGGWRMSR